jgi:glutamyl-tRNA reductase
MLSPVWIILERNGAIPGMKIVVVGLNHTTAPIELREQLAFDGTQANLALAQLHATFGHARFVLLSTCNRVELYSVSDANDWQSGRALSTFLAESRGIPLETLQPHLYVHVDTAAVEHLFRVTSSLDSLVLGESQIISQVKDSYRLAYAAGRPGKIVNRLFHTAFATSKAVHASTTIAQGRLSVAGVAINLAQQLFSDMAQARAVVLGAGHMGELLVKHLSHVGCHQISVCNRTFCRAQSLARHHGAEAVRWDELSAQLVQADIVVGSAVVQEYLFDKASFAAIMRERRHRSLLIVDIGVPRNFDPSIGELEDVYVFSVDDLTHVAQANRRSREQDVHVGLNIVQKNAMNFMEWFDRRDLGPKIGELKTAFTQISQHELDRFYGGTQEETDCRNALDPVFKRMANKIFFCVVKHVNRVAKEHGAEIASQVVTDMLQQAGTMRASPKGMAK